MSDHIDPQLLRSFVHQRSEAAFADLVRRHLDLVHSAALRHVGGDTHRAKDVTQTVFLELARKAPALVGRTSLAGWLYATACHVAARAQRSEQRRARRELASQMTQPRNDEAADAWESLRPVLDDAMHGLSGKDREAVLLRFFQNRSFAEIGAALGLRENAARMRVERALEKLRRQLARRGITSTAAMLAGVLSSNAVRPAPEGLSVLHLASSAISASAAIPWITRLTSWLGSGKAWLTTGTAVLVFAAATPSLRRTNAEPAVRVRFTRSQPSPAPEASRFGGPSAPPWLWASVESPDYRQFSANLRSSGAPEALIRDFIGIELQRHFGPRYAAIRGQSPQRPYWQKPTGSILTDEQEAQIAQVRREHHAVLRELFASRILHTTTPQSGPTYATPRAAPLQAMGSSTYFLTLLLLMRSFLIPALAGAAVAGTVWYSHRPAPPIEVIAPNRGDAARVRTDHVEPTPRMSRNLHAPGPQSGPTYATPWDALTARDDEGFVRSLRDAKCPEPTIRDLVIAVA